MTGLSVTIPTVTTDRLILRAYRNDDFDAFADFFASDRARFVGGPKDRRAAWGEFAGDIAGWILHGAGMWAVEDRAAGARALPHAADGGGAGHCRGDAARRVVGAHQGVGL